MARLPEDRSIKGLVVPALPSQVFAHEIGAAFHFLFRPYQQNS